MKFRISLILGISIILLVGGLYLSFAQLNGANETKFFMLIIGILSWLIGNKLLELENRLEHLEKESEIKKPMKQTSEVES